MASADSKGGSAKHKSWRNLKQSKAKIIKLTPPNPFPAIPRSESATGPRKSHRLGRNVLSISRKSTLGSYMRRCKEAVLEAKHKTLYLNAMGAAIPMLLTLAASIPHILPYHASQIKTEVRTGTVHVTDEIVPDDEDEDIEMRTRGKACLNIVIHIMGGDEADEHLLRRKKGKSPPTPPEDSDSDSEQPAQRGDEGDEEEEWAGIA